MIPLDQILAVATSPTDPVNYRYVFMTEKGKVWGFTVYSTNDDSSSLTSLDKLTICAQHAYITQYLC